MWKMVLGGVVVLLVVVALGSYGWTRLRPHEIRTEIEIEASPERIWAVLTDQRAYPEWNPFLVSSTGELREGGRLANEISNNGGTMKFEPRVLVVEPGRELRWIGNFVFPGLADGEHYFLIEPAGAGRSRFVQGERFTGALVPVAGSALDVEDGFKAMNAALKTRVETMTG